MKILIALVCTVIGLALGAFGSVIFLQAPPPPPPPPVAQVDTSASDRELDSMRRLIADLEDEVARLETELDRARRSTTSAREPTVADREWRAPAEASEEAARKREADSLQSAPSALQAVGLTPDEVLDLVDSDDPRERIRGLRALELLPDRGQAIELARQALADGPPWMRMQAMETLISISGETASTDIAPLLKSDTDWLARTAARRLGDLGDTSAIPALEQAFMSDTQGSLRLESALAMKRLGAPGPIGEITRGAVDDLASEDGNMRARSLRTLTQVGDPTLAYHFTNSLHDSNSDVRRTAVNGLAQYGTMADLPLLEGMLHDTVPDVVRSAERAIQFIQNPEARQQAEERGFRPIGPGR